MAEYKHYSNYFYGNKVSEYGIKNGYVDYATLAKAFDAVMNNSIIENTMEIGYWEQESGFVDNSERINALEERIEELREEEIEGAEEEIAELEELIEELADEEEDFPEIYQYFIVDGNGAEILKRYNEIVFYNDVLDMYVWGVTHWGTSWSYVLTDIKICDDDEN